MTATYTQDGTVIIFDAEVGTASGRTETEARRKIECRRSFKLAREAAKARDMVMARSFGFVQ
jgi:hypothetical protein